MCWNEFKLKWKKYVITFIVLHPSRFIHSSLITKWLPLTKSKLLLFPSMKWNIRIVRTIMKMKYSDGFRAIMEMKYSDSFRTIEEKGHTWFNFLVKSIFCHTHSHTFKLIERVGFCLFHYCCYLLCHFPFLLEFTSDEVSLYQGAREEKRMYWEKREKEKRYEKKYNPRNTNIL